MQWPGISSSTSRAYKTAQDAIGDDDGMVAAPVNLSAALAAFADIYSPRIVGRVNDYDVRIAHARGEHVWHVHDQTDEFFLVLDGIFEVTLRDADGGERTVTLHEGEMFVVPKGTEHKPSSPGGSILMFEPSGTSTTVTGTRATSRPTSTAPPATTSPAPDNRRARTDRPAAGVPRRAGSLARAGRSDRPDNQPSGTSTTRVPQF